MTDACSDGCGPCLVPLQAANSRRYSIETAGAVEETHCRLACSTQGDHHDRSRIPHVREQEHRPCVRIPASRALVPVVAPSSSKAQLAHARVLATTLRSAHHITTSRRAAHRQAQRGGNERRTRLRHLLGYAHGCKASAWTTRRHLLRSLWATARSHTVGCGTGAPAGHGEWEDATRKRIHIFYRSLQDWAGEIYDYVRPCTVDLRFPYAHGPARGSGASCVLRVACGGRSRNAAWLAASTLCTSC